MPPKTITKVPKTPKTNLGKENEKREEGLPKLKKKKAVAVALNTKEVKVEEEEVEEEEESSSDEEEEEVGDDDYLMQIRNWSSAPETVEDITANSSVSADDKSSVAALLRSFDSDELAYADLLAQVLATTSISEDALRDIVKQLEKENKIMLDESDGMMYMI